MIKLRRFCLSVFTHWALVIGLMLFPVMPSFGQSDTVTIEINNFLSNNSVHLDTTSVLKFNLLDPFVENITAQLKDAISSINVINLSNLIYCSNVQRVENKIIVSFSAKDSVSQESIFNYMSNAIKDRQYFLLEMFFKISYLCNTDIWQLYFEVPYNKKYKKVFFFDDRINVCAVPIDQKWNDAYRKMAAPLNEIRLTKNFKYKIALKKSKHSTDSTTFGILRKYLADINKSILVSRGNTLIIEDPSELLVSEIKTRQYKESSELIVWDVKLVIDSFMTGKYRKLGDKFISDGVYKYVFQSVPGLITKRRNNWEYFELAIIYSPFDGRHGNLNIFFDGGRYLVASTTGSGPIGSVIRSDGNLMEKEYLNEIRAFLNQLRTEIQTLLYSKYETK